MLANQLPTTAAATTTTTNANSIANSGSNLTANDDNANIKMERRDSSTSESSLEHLDLGRTPKKRNTGTSTPVITNERNTATDVMTVGVCAQIPMGRNLQQRLHDSSDNVTCSNESGFVEGSSSQLINNSNSVNNSKSNTSSASSTPPHNGQNGISSPELGGGEREDMKYVCPICEVVSATPHEFTNHIRCHNYASGDTENFTCRICSKVLSSASSLDRHVLVHTGERPFNCKYCHLTFTTNGFKLSATLNNNNNNNNNNNSKSNNSINSNSHINSGIALPTGVNGNFLNGIAAAESYESDGGCSSDISTVNSQSSNHNNSNNNNDVKIDNNNYKRKLEDSQLHMENVNDELKRRIKSIINNNDLIAEPIATSKASHDSTVLVCPVCNENDFSNVLALDNHMDVKHSEIPAKALKGHNRIHLTEAGPAGPFRCNMCPYSICDKAALVRHMRTHNGDRPYDECFLGRAPLDDTSSHIPVKNRSSVHTVHYFLQPKAIVIVTCYCHLCESSFAERTQCLEHIKCMHAQDFALLLAKGAIDSDVEAAQHLNSAEDEERVRTNEESSKGGKYPDYSNRKVICAFCMRRFWSTEDLRRHMRTHSGERPFQCEICLRKFTLKHSMLRHMKKHNGLHTSGNQSGGDLSANGNSGSDYSDDEQTPVTAALTTTQQSTQPNISALFMGSKIQELLNKANEWRTSGLNALGDHKENIAEESNNGQQSDLIGNLLGISDQGILNKLMSSPDEAAKLLGVEK
uniref:C2H2-type domain-containing protein n=1 Tax=Glossina pallidipes TaxID=7398 RepID=A0A1B0AEA2_GLOPL